LCHRLLADAKLHSLLARVDEDLARACRDAACRVCRGRLHRASYPRKARGPCAGEDVRRWSFCCSIEGCRKRHTPASVRFLGRRVYWSAVIVLLSALAHGVSPRRARQLREWVGVSRRTLSRWREWWLEAFVSSAIWRELSGRFDVPVDSRTLPKSLLERFAPLDQLDPLRMLSFLKLLGPLTTGNGDTAL